MPTSRRAAALIDTAVDTEDEARTRAPSSYLPAVGARRAAGARLRRRPRSADPMLMSVVPRDRRKVYKMRPIIEAVVDRGSFFEMGRNSGRSIIAGLAPGRPPESRCWPATLSTTVWRLSADVGQKVVRFVDLAETFHLPVVYLMDCPGFMIGLEAERAPPSATACAPWRHEPEHRPWCTVTRNVFWRGRRRAPARRTLVIALCLIVGYWGSLLLEGGIRGRVPRGDRRRRRPEGQTGGDRGTPRTLRFRPSAAPSVSGSRRSSTRGGTRALLCDPLRAWPNPAHAGQGRHPGPESRPHHGHSTVLADVAGSVWKIVVANGDWSTPTRADDPGIDEDGDPWRWRHAPGVDWLNCRRGRHGQRGAGCWKACCAAAEHRRRFAKSRRSSPGKVLGMYPLCRSRLMRSAPRCRSEFCLEQGKSPRFRVSSPWLRGHGLAFARIASVKHLGHAQQERIDAHVDKVVQIFRHGQRRSTCACRCRRRLSASTR